MDVGCEDVILHFLVERREGVSVACISGHRTGVTEAGLVSSGHS